MIQSGRDVGNDIINLRESPPHAKVAEWLGSRLKTMHRSAEVHVYDTSKFRLSSFLDRQGLQAGFKDYEAFEIEVDITAVLKKRGKMELAFVECKRGPITLRDIGQILGYSRVALPTLSLILSTEGLSSSVNLLLHTYNRVDLLDYAPGRRLKVGLWDLKRKQIDPSSVIPSGELG